MIGVASFLHIQAAQGVGDVAEAAREPGFIPGLARQVHAALVCLRRERVIAASKVYVANFRVASGLRVAGRPNV